MQPGGDTRRRRRTRTWLVVVAIVLAVLLVLGVLGFVAARLVGGLVGDAGGGGFDPASGETMGEADVPVERMDLTSTVAATGSLTAGRPVTLGFTGSGDVTTVEVAVGDRVVPGQVLARLDPRLAQLDLDAAEAALLAAERAAGVAPDGGGEDAVAAQIAEARVSVASARSALGASRDLAAANAAGYDSSVSSAARQRDRDAAAAAEAQAAVAAAQAAQTPPAARQAAEAELAAARADVAAADSAAVQAARITRAAVTAATKAGVDPDVDLTVKAARAGEAEAAAAVAAADKRVQRAQDVLTASDATFGAVAEARAAAQAARATADASAEAVVAAVDARRTGLASDAQTVDGARSSLSQAEAALQVLLSGGTAGGGTDGGPAPEELQVEVDRARLAVETARAGLTGTTVVAPVAGTVTAVDMTVGTAVGEGAVTQTGGTGDGGGGASAGTITVTATQALVAEVTVPETDAVLLEEGMPAELKFSALPDVVGTGQVLTVVASDPAEGGGEQGFDPFTGQSTPAQKTYTVTVTVDELPQGARGGLSIAARITTGAAPKALVVPTAAVLQADGRTMVRVVDGDAVEEVEVELGLRQGGFSEVVEGLDEGDVVRVGDPAMGVGPDGAVGPDGLVDGP